MTPIDILIQEYNNLWNEKLIHKQSIRKFHNYLTYLAAITSLALTFHGVSTTDFFPYINIGLTKEQVALMVNQAKSITNLLFVPFTPIVIITVTFPINDMFHTYAIGNQIAEIERKINLVYKNELLIWEHSVCPVIYGGIVALGKYRIENLIKTGDYFILLPILFLLNAFTMYLGASFLNERLGSIVTVLYVIVVVYMLTILIRLGFKLKGYTKPDGEIGKAIRELNYTIILEENLEK